MSSSILLKIQLFNLFTMGNTCSGGCCGGCCCGGKGDRARDGEVDAYIKKFHMKPFPHKVLKADKSDYFASQQDFQFCRTLKGAKLSDFEDEWTKKQEAREWNPAFEALLNEQANVVNTTVPCSNGARHLLAQLDDEGNPICRPVGGNDEAVKAARRKTKVDPTQVKIVLDVLVPGENGTGGKPLVRRDNPYLEIDLIDPTDPILFEGEVQKYKPGFKSHFIDRWVQCTQKAFRYFVSKPVSSATTLRPLLAIPICAIETCNVVEYDLKFKKTDNRNQELAQHQFEIFLKQDFLDFYLSSQYERNFHPEGTRINQAFKLMERETSKQKGFSPGKKQGLDLKSKFVLDENNQLDDPLSTASMTTLNTHNGSWTNREEVWILEDRRLLFATLSDAATEEWVEVLNDLMEGKLDKFYNLE